MLTAKGDKADIVAGLAAGANDYLAKPFDPGELFARLEVGQRMIEMQDSLTSRTEKLRCAREDLRVLTAHLQSVREEERACLARELHDSFGQSLTALQMDLLWLDRQMSSAHIPDVALCCDKIVSMVPLVECLIEQTQTLCSSLRPNVLLELGLVAAIEWQTEDLTKRTGLICSLAMPASEVELDPEFALALFRISQEALTNVVRHAQATRIDVSLDFDEQHLELDIHDNGRGFPPEVTSGAGAGSLGLLGMRERAAVFVGTVDFLNDPAGGATVRVRVPIPCVTPLTPTGGPV
jgi:signal transduction histidine kinase